MVSERRRASAAEFVGFLVAAAQATAAVTLALLVIRDGGSPQGTASSGTVLLGLGLIFGVLGVVVGVCGWLTLRQSTAARYLLVGGEIVLGAAGFEFLQIIGVLVTATAVVVILLVTVFSRIGRRRVAAR